ncbi:MAG: phosphohydrolase [Deltaproteobacteria bacterium]|nr:phosphohydrolase [Deltaproteobacteria bacterium]
MSNKSPAPNRRGPWMQTFLGRQYYPWKPSPEDVTIEDIAHALSLQCRFNGHSQEFYSVAQHSVLVSRTVPFQHALWGLLHDAAEAYLGDLISPIKTSIHEYKRIESLNQTAIARHFDLSKPIPIDIKEADLIVLATEARDVMGGQLYDWEIGHLPLNERIVPVGPVEAEVSFLERYIEINSCPSVCAAEDVVLR